MDPFLLAAMTLVTLTAGGVFTWLLVRRASANLSAEIAPELGQLQAVLTRHAREQASAQSQQLELQRQLEQGLASLVSERTAQSRRLDQVQSSLEGLLAKSSGAEGAPGEILRSLRELEQRLKEAQQPDWAALLSSSLRAQLNPLVESNREHWDTEAARWANQGERLEASEARLSALGGRLGQVLELVEGLARSSQSLELALAQLQPLPNQSAATPTTNPTEQQPAPTPASPAAGPVGPAADPAPSTQQASADDETPEPSGSTGSQPPVEQLAEPTAPLAGTAQEVLLAQDPADSPAAATETPKGQAVATEAELSQLELTARQLRESLLELEAALNSSSEQAAIARAENQLLRAAAQADLEQLQRRHAGHIQAIAQGLAGLDATLDRTLARGASQAHRHSLSA